MTRILAITGAKGGTGKTTTAVNLAAAFATDGRRVELRDLDPQASATRALGQRPAEDPLQAAPLPLKHDRLPSGRLLLRPAGRALIRIERGELAPDGLVRPHERWAADLCIFDCPPALGTLTTAALQSADVALVPLEATPLAFHAIGDLKLAFDELSWKPRLRAVLTRVQNRRRLTAEMRDLIERTYPRVLCDSEIPEDVRAAEAPGAELPVTLHAPGASASDAYLRLARELAPLFGFR